MQLLQPLSFCRQRCVYQNAKTVGDLGNRILRKVGDHTTYSCFHKHLYRTNKSNPSFSSTMQVCIPYVLPSIRLKISIIKCTLFAPSLSPFTPLHNHGHEGKSFILISKLCLSLAILSTTLSPHPPTPSTTSTPTCFPAVEAASEAKMKQTYLTTNKQSHSDPAPT